MAGLFGPSAAEVQQRMQLEIANNARQFSGLTGGAVAGTLFGRAAQNLMGQAADPRLKKAQALQSIEQEMTQMGLEPGTPQFTDTLGKLMMTRVGPQEAAQAVNMARQMEVQRAEVDAIRSGPAQAQRKAESYFRILTGQGYPAGMAAELAGNEELAEAAIKEKLKPQQMSSMYRMYQEALQEGYQGGFLPFVKEVKKSGATNVSQTTIGGYKVPAGFMSADPNDPSKGVVPIPGGPRDSQTPEAAAKTAMLEQARNSVARFKELIAPNGNVDRANILAMQGSIPGTSGRQARVLILDAIEAKLRAESGAAVPPQEVTRAAERFMPSTFDNDALVLDKMRRLDDFLKSTVSKIDPTGSFTESPEEIPIEEMTDEQLRELAK